MALVEVLAVIQTPEEIASHSRIMWEDAIHRAACDGDIEAFATLAREGRRRLEPARLSFDLHVAERHMLNVFLRHERMILDHVIRYREPVRSWRTWEDAVALPQPTTRQAERAPVDAQPQRPEIAQGRARP